MPLYTCVSRVSHASVTEMHRGGESGSTEGKGGGGERAEGRQGDHGANADEV